MPKQEPLKIEKEKFDALLHSLEAIT